MRGFYRGTGTIDGQEGRGFMLTAIDCDVNAGGGVDRLRIRIWVPNTGVVICDNEMNVPDDVAPTRLLVEVRRDPPGLALVGAQHAAPLQDQCPGRPSYSYLL
jgi:hypothetical protein